MERLKEKYTNLTEKAKEKNKNKIELSNDAYAICEFIENLINKMEHARRSMLRK